MVREVKSLIVQFCLDSVKASSAGQLLLALKPPKGYYDLPWYRVDSPSTNPMCAIDIIAYLGYADFLSTLMREVSVSQDAGILSRINAILVGCSWS